MSAGISFECCEEGVRLDDPSFLLRNLPHVEMQALCKSRQAVAGVISKQVCFISSITAEMLVLKRPMQGLRQVVGVIGAGGWVGRKVVHELLAQGWKGRHLAVVGRERAKIDPLAKRGVVVYTTVSDLVSACSLVVVCVGCEDLSLINKEILPGLLERRLVMSTATGLTGDAQRSALVAPHLIRTQVHCCSDHLQDSNAHAARHFIRSPQQLVEVFTACEGYITRVLGREGARDLCLQVLLGLDPNNTAAGASISGGASSLTSMKSSLSSNYSLASGEARDWPPQDLVIVRNQLDQNICQTFQEHLCSHINAVDVPLPLNRRWLRDGVELPHDGIVTNGEP
ncbi:unnamed protein product [Chrysoparadoxa australica]